MSLFHYQATYARDRGFLTSDVTKMLSAHISKRRQIVAKLTTRLKKVPRPRSVRKGAKRKKTPASARAAPLVGKSQQEDIEGYSQPGGLRYRAIREGYKTPTRLNQLQLYVLGDTTNAAFPDAYIRDQPKTDPLFEDWTGQVGTQAEPNPNFEAMRTLDFGNADATASDQKVAQLTNAAIVEKITTGDPGFIPKWRTDIQLFMSQAVCARDRG